MGNALIFYHILPTRSFGKKLFEDQSRAHLYVDFFLKLRAPFLTMWVLCWILNYLIIHGFRSPRLKSSPTIRFLKLDFVFLRDARIHDMLTLVCKCLVNKALFYLTSLFHVRFSKYNLRGVKKLIVPNVATTTFRLNTFQWWAISNWNSLPVETRRAPDLNTFVRMYKAVKNWS